MAETETTQSKKAALDIKAAKRKNEKKKLLKRL